MCSEFASNDSLSIALSVIGEEYYIKGFTLEGKGQDVQAKECMQKAIPIWERVVKEYPASSVAAQACCWVGDCYGKLGEYQNSIEYYQKAVDNYPAHSKGWHALSRLGRNYEELKLSAAISESEANAKIKEAYQTLVERYPNCKAAQVAQRWLNGHNGN